MQITGDTAATDYGEGTGIRANGGLFVVEQNDGTDVFKVDKDGYITKQFDPDAASYIVWKSGSTYYAKNGANGSSGVLGEHRSTMSCKPAITAVDAAGGGKIPLRDGNYSWATT